MSCTLTAIFISTEQVLRMQNVDKYILGTQLPLEDLAPRYEGVIFLNCSQRTSPLLAMLAPDVVESYGILGRQALLTLFLPEACGKMLLWKIAVFRSAHNPDGSNKL